MSEPESPMFVGPRDLDRLRPQERESLRSESRLALAELQGLIAADSVRQAGQGPGERTCDVRTGNAPDDTPGQGKLWPTHSGGCDGG